MHCAAFPGESHKDRAGGAKEQSGSRPAEGRGWRYVAGIIVIVTFIIVIVIIVVIVIIIVIVIVIIVIVIIVVIVIIIVIIIIIITIFINVIIVIIIRRAHGQKGKGVLPAGHPAPRA